MTKAERRQQRKTRRVTNHEPLLQLVTDEVVRRKTPKIIALTDVQKEYDGAIRSKPLVFGVGPAGTGKSYLAAMRAAEALASKQIERIVVTRPVVEAGESLGYLPGAINEKYEPYFRPVRDVFEEYLGRGALEYYLKKGVIEARPLAYLRGVTFKNTWLIADEMQNATVGQMKLLLTRIGEGAKFLINGDPSQVDIPSRSSGLMDAVDRLCHLHDAVVVRFHRDDIVRSDLCQLIVDCYSKSL